MGAGGAGIRLNAGAAAHGDCESQTEGGKVRCRYSPWGLRESNGRGERSNGKAGRAWSCVDFVRVEKKEDSHSRNQVPHWPLDAMLFGEGTRSLSQLRVAWEGVCAAAAFWMPCCGADCEFPFSRSTDGPDFQLSSRSATAECSTTRPGPGRAAATSTRASPTMSSMTLTRPRCATLLRGRLALSAKARARRCSRRARGLRAVPRACDAAL